MKMTVTEIIDLLVFKGGSQYGGESINQLQHALQCAHLAEISNETPQLIIACLLHDIGHLITEEFSETRETSSHQDDLHQFIALPFLRPLFPEDVLGPIKLHVDAKRYLCFSDKAYWDSLSPTSKHTLELQGGVFSSQAAQIFIDKPFAQDAIKLRRYDDQAKVPNGKTPPISHYRKIAESF